MAEKLPFRLILASASPARRYLLGRAGYTFDVIPSHIDEPTAERFPDPRTLVAHIAWLKAKEVVGQIASAEPTVILAADTIGWHAGHVLGKPADRADARRILDILAGTTHELWTGVCLWLKPAGVQVTFQERSLVAMKALDDAELDAYLAGNAWEGNSGAYAIRESGDDPFVRVVEGELTNVIGLPMPALEAVLGKVGRQFTD